MSIYRENTDWTTLTPIQRVGPVTSYITLPDFSYSGILWKGVSEIVCQYNFSAAKSFVLRNLPTPASGVTYLVCIRYRVGNTVFRYKLYSDVGEVLSGVPLYTGQVIKKNFVLEVWNIANVTAPANAADINYETSITSIPTDFRTLSQTELTTSTAVTYDDLKITAQENYTLDEPTYHWRGANNASPVTISEIDSGPAFTLKSGAVTPIYNAGSTTYTNNKPFAQLVAGSSLETTASVNPCALFYLAIRQRTHSNGREIFMSNDIEITQITPSPNIQIKHVPSGVTVALTSIPVDANAGFYLIAVSGVTTFNLLGYGVYDITSGYSLLESGVTSSISTDTFNFTTMYLGIGSVGGSCALVDVLDFAIWDNSEVPDNANANAYYLSRYKESAIVFPVTTTTGNAWLDNTP